MVDLRAFQGEIDSLLSEGNKAYIQVTDGKDVSHTKIRLVFSGEFTIAQTGSIASIASRAAKHFWANAYEDAEGRVKW